MLPDLSPVTPAGSRADQKTFVLVGAGPLLARCGERLLTEGHRIAAVVTSDEAVQRWAGRAAARHLPLGAGLVTVLRAEPFDILLSVGNNVVLPAELIRLPSQAAVNFHLAPLPRYGGLNAASWALIGGETDYGVTWHRMVPQAGAGNILVQRRVPIDDSDTATTLHAKCLEAGFESFDDVLTMLADDWPGTPHTLDACTFRLAADRPEAMGVLDWSRPPQQLARLARALDFGAHQNPLTMPKLLLGNDHVIVTQIAATAASTPAAQPGTVLSAEHDGLTVAAGDGAVRLGGFETADGIPLAAADLGRRWQVRPGTLLPCPGREGLKGLDDALSPIARAERDWVHRLQALEPAVLEDGGRGGIEREVDVHVQRLTAEAANALTPTGASVPDALCAAIALFLAAWTKRQHLDVATPAYLSALPETARGLVLPWVPVRLEFDPGAPAMRAVAAAAAAIRAARHRAPIARDLWRRMPQLGDRYARPQLAIGVTDGKSDSAGAIGAPITVTVDPHGIVTWRSTRASREPSVLAAGFASIVDQILVAPSGPAGSLRVPPPEEIKIELESWVEREPREPALDCHAGAPAAR